MSISTPIRSDEDQFCDVAGGIRLCYRTYGSVENTPLLLVVGLGLQLTYWPPALIGGLVRRGFRVVVFDNRDVGRSTRVQAKPPGLLRQLFRRPESTAYDLGDMARDAVGLLNHLGIDEAHVVGMSMGGMIAQTLATQHARRVLSLTSIFSTTGASRVGQPAASSLLLLSKPPARSRDQAIERYVQMMAHIGPTRYPMDEQELRAYAAHAWDRGPDGRAHEGIARQIGAIMKSGDRTEQLKGITAPTLVLHGDRDRLVAPSGGAATADAIPGARLITIPGLGHFIPNGAVDSLLDLISGHATRSHLPNNSSPRRATPDAQSRRA